MRGDEEDSPQRYFPSANLGGYKRGNTERERFYRSTISSKIDSLQKYDFE